MVCSHSSGKTPDPAHSLNALEFLRHERDRLKQENSRLQQEINDLQHSPYTKLGKAFSICSQYPDVFGDVDLEKFCALFFDNTDNDTSADDDKDNHKGSNNEDDESEYDEEAICVCLLTNHEDKHGE